MLRRQEVTFSSRISTAHVRVWVSSRARTVYSGEKNTKLPYYGLRERLLPILCDLSVFLLLILWSR